MSNQTVEIHILQSFPASNLNRGEDGSPKAVWMGSAPRARISSQAIKRAIRLNPEFWITVKRTLGHEAVAGIRTRFLADRVLVPEFLAKDKPEEQVQAVARLVSGYFAGKSGKLDEENRNLSLLYLSPTEVQQLVTLCLNNWDALVADSAPKADKKEVVRLINEFIKKLGGRTDALDLALFGRMLADRPDLNLDAACQVAHAVSTGSTTVQTDFFTAVDDLATADSGSAGMLGISPFVAPCYYRYAAINMKLLLSNLAGDEGLAKAGVAGFLRTAILTIPTGKQNSYAAFTMPAFVMVVIRENGRPISLVNAFENPVRSTGNGLIEPSIVALTTHWNNLAQMYGLEDTTAVLTLIDSSYTTYPGEKVDSLPTLIRQAIGNL